MTRDRRIVSRRRCAASLLAVLVSGCAPLFRPQETVVRVDAVRNSAKAQRLTGTAIKAFRHGKLERAAEALEHAIAADPTYGPAHNNLGLVHYERGELYRAILAFEQAMEFLPYDPTAVYNLALALESAGQAYEALDLYTRAVEMDPDHPVFLGNLLRLRVRLGDQDPLLMQQLEELMVIETRPEWRRWADRQLALFQNPALDRGPSTPEFDAAPGRSRREAVDPSDRIIELAPESPEDRPREPGSDPGSVPQGPPRPPDVSEPLPAPEPIPIRSPRTLDPLPPTIQGPMLEAPSVEVGPGAEGAGWIEYDASADRS